MSEVKEFLLRQREGLRRVEQLQWEEAMAMTPEERLAETISLCDFGAAMDRAAGKPPITLEQYLAEHAHCRPLAEAWKKRNPA